MFTALQNLEPPVQAALIAGVVGFLAGLAGSYFRFFLDKRALRDRIEVEFQDSERRKLRELIGRYHGRVLGATERLNYRLWNLQENESEGWLDMHGEYDRPAENYYFTTSAYRIIELLALVRLFEAEAIYIDARIAKEGELAFAQFGKAFQWTLTDADIFKGLPYNAFWQRDHFFHDKLRLICDACISEGGVIPLETFQERLKTESGRQAVMPLLTFLDGLRASEDRFRWDRLVAFHLLLMAFINTFGYQAQFSSAEQFRQIAASARYWPVMENLAARLPGLGLAKETAAIANAVATIRSLREAEPPAH